MADPFTIRIFVPDGDAEGVRLIDRMNWTGLGLVFPRAKWPEVRKRPEMLRTGVYVLVGYKSDEDDLPTIYVGQADSVRDRIQSHSKTKDFWHWSVVFVSSGDGLNRAHVTWLEHALLKRATEARRCHLDNGNAPQEPGLSEAEKAGHTGIPEGDSTNPAARRLAGFRVPEGSRCARGVRSVSYQAASVLYARHNYRTGSEGGF